MPWSYPDEVPAVAQNWTADEQRRCVEAANAALEETGNEEQAIYACIAAAGKGRKEDNEMARRYVVAGAPCSGKSTFVRAHARPGDLIYDYDSVHMALSGRAAHDHDPLIQPFVLAARDGVLRELEIRGEQPAWVITATQKNSDLEALRDRLGAEVVLLTVERDEAHRRCDAEERPEAWHGYIDRWFDEGDIDPGAWTMPDIKGRDERMPQRKSYRAPISLKADGEEGMFEAVFATFNVIDHDGDVTRPGAFKEGQKVRISAWGHDWYVLPVGKGVIHADQEKAWVEGRFFLDTDGGLNTYKTVKGLEELQEWSYGFDIERSGQGEFDEQQVRFLEALEVYEVSPVMLGAGVGTRTTAIKGTPGGAGEGGAARTDDDANGPEGEARNGNPSGGEAERVRLNCDLDLLEFEQEQ